MASFKKQTTGWEYRIRYKDPITQKFKEKSQRGFETKKEAQIAAADTERKIAEGYEQTDTPLLDYLEQYVQEYKVGTVRKNTIIQHRNNIENHIKPYFQQIMLREVKPIRYQQFLNQLADNYSKSTVEIIHNTMNGALEKAVILGKLEKNPCKGVTIKGSVKPKGLKFIESEHIPAFLRSAHQYGYIYWIFYRVLIETGMRKGETAALTWDDIDLKAGTLSINKTLDFAAEDEAELFGDTKTFNSERTIKISQSIISDLKQHIKYQNQNKLAWKGSYKHNLNLVLCRDDGNFMPKSSLFNSFSRILKRAGLPSMPIHSLRHTHAVLLLEAGNDMKYVQERLGHGSMRITADVYSHVSKKIEESSMEKYEAHMRSILE
ncbi:integrase [Paenibacillus helianthi]|uniref:Integrase n=1 Tax=Paenibacillus helianthi TaxID=1349432 RepID=A0ABX3EES3_9BACL|nr:site-specific integrase [Paenibacillus helianthi]OKP78734.1 integrase [Paenibacillus helianthi]